MVELVGLTPLAMAPYRSVWCAALTAVCSRRRVHHAPCTTDDFAVLALQSD